MANERFRCRHCGKLKPRRIPDQRYCSDKACQKARKNAWRRERYAADADYRINQRKSTNAWLETQGGAAAYHRRRRKACKQSRNEEVNSQSEAKPTADSGADPHQGRDANSDASTGKSPDISGRYELIPLRGANSDAFEVEIRIISGS